MPATPTANRTNYLVVNSMPCATAAWWITNLEEEINKASALKGGDLDLPAASGALGFPRRRAATVYQFEMLFRGDYASDGTTQTYKHGLGVNIRQFRDGIGLASSSGDGTVTAVYHDPDGSSTLTTTVHILRFETAVLDHKNAKAVLEVSSPSGVWT